MGIIKRQGIKSSIVNYVGVFIGAMSSIFIYPLIDLTQMGMIRFVIDNSLLLAAFAGFTSSLTAIQFFPIFKDEKNNHNGFLFLITAFTCISSLIFLTGIYIFKTPVSHLFSEPEHFLKLLPYLLFFTFIITLANLYQAFAMNFNRIVVPSIFHNLLLKLAQPSLILLFYYGFISFSAVFFGLGIAFTFMLMGLVGYIGFLGQLKLKPNFRLATPQLVKQMMSYSGFNMLVSLGSILTQKVDGFLIPLLLNYSNGAIFGFGGMIAEAIDVPRKALSSISTPLLAESLKKGNIAHVDEIYKKTALLQLIVGVYLLVGVWVCADALFDLMPKNGDLYRQGKIIILLLGLARVADMATGVNTEIITYSEHYRFNLRSLAVLAILNLILNLILIPILGMAGSALATLISIAVVNLWRLFFIKQKLGIQPLNFKMLSVLVIGFLSFVAANYTPSVENPILTILLKGMIVTIIYGFLILKLKISGDVNHTFKSIREKIGI